MKSSISRLGTNLLYTTLMLLCLIFISKKQKLCIFLNCKRNIGESWRERLNTAETRSKNPYKVTKRLILKR